MKPGIINEHNSLLVYKLYNENISHGMELCFLVVWKAFWYAVKQSRELDHWFCLTWLYTGLYRLSTEIKLCLHCRHKLLPNKWLPETLGSLFVLDINLFTDWFSLVPFTSPDWFHWQFELYLGKIGVYSLFLLLLSFSVSWFTH